MHESTTTPDGESAGRGSVVWRLIREIIIVLILGLLLSVIIRTFVAQVFSIPSGSMENTLQVGDRVVVQKVGSYERGDIIVFSDHAGWLSAQPQTPERGAFGKALEFLGVLPDTGTNHLIKRVVGLPGDTVECCTTEGLLAINGVAIDESSYLYTSANGPVAPADVPFKVTVPADRLFVLGDHRNASRDSRCYLGDISLNGPRGDAAFVPTRNVVGTAWAIMFPFENATFFDTPEVYQTVPEPPPAPDRAVIEPEGVGC